MTVVEHKWSALPVPYAIDVVDRVRKERYYDPDFYAMEAELLWPRVWQMACRLEEIPLLGDFAEYQILDQSVLVVRTEDGVRAFHNTCRHRGVRIARGPGVAAGAASCARSTAGATRQTARTPRSPRPVRSRSTTSSRPANSISRPCAARSGAVAPGSTSTRRRRPFANASNLRPVSSTPGRWSRSAVEWWFACRLPANWKIAEEAFVEQYHVLQAHPQLRLPGRIPTRDPADFDPQAFVEAELQYLRVMSEGMAGMVHAHDVEIAEGLAAVELPADYTSARTTWERRLNEAVTGTHRARGVRHPRPERAAGPGHQRDDVLRVPSLLRSSDVQQRLVLPVPAARTRGDPDGDLVVDA